MRSATKNRAKIKDAIEKVLRDEKNKASLSEIEIPVKRKFVKEEEIMFTSTPVGAESG